MSIEINFPWWVLPLLIVYLLLDWPLLILVMTLDRFVGIKTSDMMHRFLNGTYAVIWFALIMLALYIWGGYHAYLWLTH